MTERNAAHGMFCIERIYPASPARVFRAFQDPVAKAAWFNGGPECTILAQEMDFRVGGREQSRGRWTSGHVSHFDAIYHDIIPNERIVFSYDMYVDDAKISVSLTTVEIKASGAGTRLIFTEQDVFLDGFEDNGGREHGTGEVLDRLGKSLETVAA